MDFTGSLNNITAPLSADLGVSSLADATGSSAIDTVLGTLVGLPNLLLALVAGIGADAGSTLGNPFA